MRTTLIYIFLAFVFSKGFCQDDIYSLYDSIVKLTRDKIVAQNAQIFFVDNIISNSNDRKIGHGTDKYYWNCDTLYMITSEKYINLRRFRYTIYYLNNQPIFYRKKPKAKSSSYILPKKIFYIDNKSGEVYNLKGNKLPDKKLANKILYDSKQFFKYWESNIKNLNLSEQE